MRPTLDTESESKPDYLPPDAKLQAGYIRYIRLLPTKDCFGEIRLETCIRRSRLDDESDENRTPEKFFYSAISYSWGDPTPSRTVVVDGQERLVAENLWQFLQRANLQRIDLQQDRSQRVERVRSEQADWSKISFESPTAYSQFKDAMESMLRYSKSQNAEISITERFSRIIPRLKRGIEHLGYEHRMKDIVSERVGWPEDWLWIDALCIDQLDAHERTHQVGIMSQIFGRADQVISWLGPAYDNSEHAMNAFAGYTSERESSEHLILDQRELSEAICRLCERPYWKRLWVFQELKHAKDIKLMCGDETISWSQFKQLWRAIIEIATTDEVRSERLNQSLATRMMTLRSKPMNFSLWNLLNETRNLECADRRDRVYALLSVATEGHKGIEADYEIVPLRLAHRTLQGRYAIRPPRAVNDVSMDCKFLEDVFRLTEGAMLRYCRHGTCDPLVRDQWYRREGRVGSGAEFYFEHEQSSLYVDTESSQASLFWSGWRQFHDPECIAYSLLNII
jgi:hypothetical protein